MFPQEILDMILLQSSNSNAIFEFCSTYAIKKHSKRNIVLFISIDRYNKIYSDSRYEILCKILKHKEQLRETIGVKTKRNSTNYLCIDCYNHSKIY